MADITVGKNGPYAVRGLPLARARMDLGDGDGHAQAWIVHEEINTSAEADDDGTYWLCRCGQSANKPFCDGSHKRVDFQGAENANPAPYREQAKLLQGDGVVVRDMRSLCEHAGFCQTRTSDVWHLVDSNDPEVQATMKAMVGHCPSGRLTHAPDASAPDDEPDLPRRVLVVDDGPYLLEGGLSLQGQETAYETRNRMTVCRCGQSKNKPFCDGMHAVDGFEDH